MNADTFRETDIFKSSLKLSLIAHVTLVLFFSVKTYFFPSESIDFTAAVRVDIIALPDKLDPSKVKLAKPEEKPTPPAPEPKPVKEVAKPKPPKPEPDTINLKKTKSKQSEALEKLKRQAALDKIKNELATKSAEASSPKETITQVKGNVLSAGTALTGLNKLQHESYIAELDQHIKQNWTLPEWLARQNYKARARLRLDQAGRILSREIIRSSGNEAYDDIVLETIDRSAPYPAPPEKFLTIVGAQGIVIGFPE